MSACKVEIPPSPRSVTPPLGERLRRAAKEGDAPVAFAPEVIVRRYGSMAPLAPADVALLRSLMSSQTAIDAGHELECEGLASRAPRLLLTGWACRFRILSDGRRTIVGFSLPGDPVCFCKRAYAPTSTMALTPCRVLDATPLRDAIASCDAAHARLAEAQELLDAMDEAYLLDHVVRLSRQTALERICHLLLEFRWRLQTVGLVRAREFALPLTQESLADAVGLSIVHVNRTLQDLRKRGFIALRHGRVALLEPERMAAVAEFRPPMPMRERAGQRSVRSGARPN
jgi:CRP-like cAMP-binding protein